MSADHMRQLFRMDPELASALGMSLAAVGAAARAVGSQFRAAVEWEQELANARAILGPDVNLDPFKERAQSAALTKGVTLVAALRAAVAAEISPDAARAHWAHLLGYHTLADVIDRQEGRRIVRDGLRDVRVWLGEVNP